MAEAAHRAAERAARESYGRLVAFLAARNRDVAGAEDALAEAFASALQTWPESGVPDNPDAWLLTVARRRQADAARRQATRKAGEAHLTMIADELGEGGDRGPIPDRRLALMFACAHPEVEPAMRAPLILQTVLGLTAVDIAAAFLLPPATMGQRLVRAKARIRDGGVPFAEPEPEELPERLDAVLAAIYATFTRGWTDPLDSGPERLAEEAIWLAQVVVTLLPDSPEAKGLLALMLYAEARSGARRDSAGAYVPFERQDTSLWDRAAIAAAEAMLHAANSSGPTGRYQIEAAIQSAHLARRLGGKDTWPAVVQLYDVLMRLSPSPVVLLNRAAALAEVEGPEAALRSLESIAGDKRLDTYQPLWAVRGYLLAKAGRKAEAHEALSLAIGLADDQAVRQYLMQQRAALADG
ncbi:RNA polymerase sigma factor [Devosia albogilva]|uniref:RNA polymerase sigma factor n=1 Tax=Devosia albogilva TaxID=429726 RepID=A0ABW5QGG6_9HYPH